jgi:hypothetical protein
MTRRDEHREHDSHTLRDELIAAMRLQYPMKPGETKVELESVARNAFCLRVDGGPIFTVTVTYGGTIDTRTSRAVTTPEARAQTTACEAGLHGLCDGSGNTPAGDTVDCSCHCHIGSRSHGPDYSIEHTS